MRLDPRRAASLLRDPGAAARWLGSIRAVVLHGDDEGLIRERAQALAAAVTGGADDAFRVTWLERGEHGRLPDEAASQSLLGGRRVVRVRDAGDPLLVPLRQALLGPGEALLLIEAPGLPGRSRVRALAEERAAAAAIACYAEEGRDLAASLRAALEAAGVRAEPDALEWLAGQLGADKGATRGEIEKLVLHAGEGKRLDLAAVQACVGSSAATALDDAVFAATAGEVAEADRALDAALRDGTAPIAVLRSLLSHLQRLHQARLRVDAGMAAGEAVKALRPPVFFRRTAAFTRAVSMWSSPGLLAALARLSAAEATCKTTGARDDAVTRELVAWLARSAARRNSVPA